MTKEKYIGWIKRTNPYYNFEPLAKIEGLTIKCLTEDEKQSELKYNSRYKVVGLRTQPGPRIEEVADSKALVIFEYDFQDLEKPSYGHGYNERNYTNQISKDNCFAQRLWDNETIRYLHLDNICYAIKMGDFNAFYSDNEILIIETNHRFPAGEKIFLELLKATWVGPFEVLPEETDEEVTDEEVTDEEVTDEEVTDEEVTDEEVTDEEVTDEEVTDEEVTDEEVTDEEVTDEEVTDEEKLKKFNFTTKLRKKVQKPIFCSDTDIKELTSNYRETLNWNIVLLEDEACFEILKTNVIDVGEERECSNDEDEQAENDNDSQREVFELEQKELASKVSDLKTQIEILENSSNVIKKEFGAFLENTGKRMADVIIDGFLSSKMIKAAAEWENYESDQHRTFFIQNDKIEEKEPDVLIDNLCEAIQTVRPQYDRNTIINIAICITQGFLTVFSGEPGCGKTSICNYFGQVLGLNNIYKKIIEGKEDKDNKEDMEFFNRYTVVSVERGWTTKRDFIGYYNPLSKAFDKSNRKVYDALYQLDFESKNSNSKLPYLILLDEANLSPMEYYWSDFITICDKLTDQNNDEQAKSKEPVQVNLGGDFVFNIPKTLRFVATINNDHTTETLSPRLIDRAWVVTLPSHDENENSDGGTEIPDEMINIVSWGSLCAAFAKVDDQPKKIDKQVLDKLREQRIVVSYRVQKAIERYLTVASVRFDEVTIAIEKVDKKADNNKDNSSSSQSDHKETSISVEYRFKDSYTDDNNENAKQIKRSFAINVLEKSYNKIQDNNEVGSDIIAMDYAILQRILPKLSGSGESFETWLNEFKDLLFEKKLFMSANKVDEIINRGNDQLKYYQFFC